MSEVRTGEFSKWRSNMLDEHALLKVWLWDIGPEKPVAPERPIAPRGQAGDPEYDLAVIELRDKLAGYEARLKEYGRRKDEFADWEIRVGGAIEVLFWSTDARDALANDQRVVAENRQSRRRYYVSSRTRGHSGLANQGLPPDVKPGRAHAENLERQAAGDAALQQARRDDPVFGAGAV